MFIEFEPPVPRIRAPRPPRARGQYAPTRTDLKESVTALADPALLTGGKDGIQSALDTVKANLDAFGDAAGETYKPEVDATKSAVNDLESAVSDIGSGSVTETLQTRWYHRIANVGTTSAALMTKLTTACPSS